MGILVRHSEGQIYFDFGAATLPVADHELTGSVWVKARNPLLCYGKTQTSRSLQVPPRRKADAIIKHANLHSIVDTPCRNDNRSAGGAPRDAVPYGVFD
jgi:hypothetical protein